MCGRFTLAADLDELAARFAFESTYLEYKPHYNLAPGQPVLAVINDGQNRAEFFRWGLIPFWAKDPSIGYRTINARAETVAQKPSFRVPLQKRRCLILADGFYEWKKDGVKKTPMRIVLRSRDPFAFAGLWDEWASPAGETIRSCAIITTRANSVVEPIHDRMPVILPRVAEGLWLDQNIDDPTTLTQMLLPHPAEVMEAYAVSSLVNSARYDNPSLIVPLG